MKCLQEDFGSDPVIERHYTRALQLGELLQVCKNSGGAPLSLIGRNRPPDLTKMATGGGLIQEAKLMLSSCCSVSQSFL